MIDLVVFDMAGTTVQDGNGVQTCLRDALAVAGAHVTPADADAVMGLPKPIAIKMLLDKYGVYADIDPIHDNFTKLMQDYYRTGSNISEIPGATAAFAQLREAGVKVALDTGFFRPIVDVLLARLGWKEQSLIDGDITSDEVAQGRPHPDMVHHLMKRFNITDASRVAKVGDTQSDMEEGTSAGCRFVIGVLSGSSTREQLESWPHTHIVDSVADVPAIILGEAK